MYRQFFKRTLTGPKHKFMAMGVLGAFALGNTATAYAKGKTVDPYFDLIMDESLAQNKYPAAKMAAIRKNDHVPLAVKYCTEKVWNQYKDTKSSGPADWTMARTINSGVMNPISFVGCHVGDMESYDDFKDFWYPLIEDYHKGFKVNEPKRAEETTASRFDINKLPELSPEATKRIVSTRIRCARNLADFPLNPGAKSALTRYQILQMMEMVYDQFPADFKGTLYKHEVMSDEERQKLVDDHFLFRGKDKMQASSGYHEHWPKGRGIFVRDDKKFLNWLNEGDHIRIISMEYGSDVKAVFNRLGQGACLVEDGIRKIAGKNSTEPVFMFHPKLGSVTCCPSNLGSGLRASVFLKIPNLIAVLGFHEIDRMCRADFDCQVRGSSGEHSEVKEFVDVSNWRRIGFWEYELVTDMIVCTNHLAKLEEELANLPAHKLEELKSKKSLTA